MTRQEFLRIVMDAQRLHPDWRMGQAVFNRAYAQPELREKTDELRGGSIDPFYDDDRIDAFLDALFGDDDDTLR